MLRLSDHYIGRIIKPGSPPIFGKIPGLASQSFFPQTIPSYDGMGAERLTTVLFTETLLSVFLIGFSRRADYRIRRHEFSLQEIRT